LPTKKELPKLTDRVVVTIKPRNGRRIDLIPDISGNGLCLQVSQTGSKLWKFRYSHAGRRNRLHDIGDATLIMYEEAKAEAMRLQRMVKVEKRSPKAAEYDPKTAATFNDVLDLHVATLAQSTQDNMKTKLKPLRDAFGAEPVLDVSRTRLADFINERWPNKPRAAELAAVNVAAAFTKALHPDSGLKMPEGFVNPAKNLRPRLKALAGRVVKSRAVAWESDELQTIFKALNLGYGDPTIGDIGVACLELILLTGARPEEVQSLRWDEIEPVSGEPQLRYLIKDRHKTWKKTGRPRRIIVSDLGIKVLGRAERWKRKDCPYVFPAARDQRNTKFGYFTSDTELCVKLSNKVGMQFRPGSFRSAYINFMLESLEAKAEDFRSFYDALEVVAENANHKDVRITLEHYRKGKDSKMHEAIKLTNDAFTKLLKAA
jgi:integrase